MTFRAILHGVAKASSSEIISYIEQWISNDITIPVQKVLINVDSSCTVSISSFDDRECQVISRQPRNDSTVAIAGGISSALLLILILAGGTVSILLWFRKRRKIYSVTSRYDNILTLHELNVEGIMNGEIMLIKIMIIIRRDPKDEIQMSETNLPDNTPNEYEELDEYNREYEEVAQMDLSMTQCPAYEPTMHTNM